MDATQKTLEALDVLSELDDSLKKAWTSNEELYRYIEQTKDGVRLACNHDRLVTLCNISLDYIREAHSLVMTYDEKLSKQVEEKINA